MVVFAGLLDREARGPQLHPDPLRPGCRVGGLEVDAGFLVDPLSITMALFVTGVGALIHLYSIGYMHGDPRFPEFFVYLNLFAFSMLMLVLGDNLLLTFLGWEGVGACSYFLISFWFSDEANAVAGKKAFVTNRVGDWGFMVAMFLTLRRARLAAPTTTIFEAAELRRAGRRSPPRPSPCCSSSAPSASRPSSRSTCGCPTPWPARRRCRR